MKFDKFAKKVGADGTIYSMNLNGEVVNFLASPYDNLMARIPDDKQIVAFKKLDMPKPLRDIIMEVENDEYTHCERANLVQCIAPFADCKQKDLLRVYNQMTWYSKEQLVIVSIHSLKMKTISFFTQD